MKASRLVRYVLIIALIVIVSALVSTCNANNAVKSRNAEINSEIANIHILITNLQSTVDQLNTREAGDNKAALTKINNLANNLENEIQALRASINGQ